jgi:NADPH-dependent curcumin reductase CurA
MTHTARQVRLRQRPVGRPDADTWELTTEELPSPSAGHVLVKVDYVSLEPAMRGWITDVRSYIPPVEIGAVMRAYGVGTVMASGDTNFSVGDTVAGMLGATDLALCDPAELALADPSVADGPTWLGALGIPGMTAYFGLLEVGRLAAGDTVVVSGAAGGVGSLVGQIAKARGARVIGIAGGAQKCAWLTEELRFDAAIDYKSEPVLKALRKAAPDGIDVFFDNVGGEALDAALANLRRGARVVLCGAVSAYNATSLPPGPSRYMALLVFRASMTGFIVFDYEDRFPEAVEAISGWLADGTVTARAHVVHGGIETFGVTLEMLFNGANTGKLVLKLQ